MLFDFALYTCVNIGTGFAMKRASQTNFISFDIALSTKTSFEGSIQFPVTIFIAKTAFSFTLAL